MRHSLAAEDSRRNLGFALLALGLCGGMSLPLNTIFTLLKETPVFWHTVGGYPVALRELVLLAYYPLLIANLVLCGSMTAVFQWSSVLKGGVSRNTLAVVLLFWGMWYLNAGLLLANNVENLMQGRPFHFHPVHDWSP